MLITNVIYNLQTGGERGVGRERKGGRVREREKKGERERE